VTEHNYSESKKRKKRIDFNNKPIIPLLLSFWDLMNSMNSIEFKQIIVDIYIYAMYD